MFRNQLVDLPSTRLHAYKFIATPDSPLVLVWGGSYGLLEDIHSTAAPLIIFFNQNDNVRFELMGDPQLAVFFLPYRPTNFVFILLVL